MLTFVLFLAAMLECRARNGYRMRQSVLAAKGFCLFCIVLINVSLAGAGAAEAPEEPAKIEQPAEAEEAAGKEALAGLEKTPLGPALQWLFNEDRKYFILPIFSTGPDTGWMLGLAWYHTDLFGKDKRDLVLGAIMTQSGQNNFMFSWAEPGIPLKEGRVALSFFYSDNPSGGIRYFGEGNRSRYEEVASNYRANVRGVGLAYIYDFNQRLTLFSHYGYSLSEFDDPTEDFDLAGDRFSSRPISEVHPGLFQSEEFQEGYRTGELAAILSYDSREKKRLMRIGPGYKWKGSFSWADRDFGGDYDWIVVNSEFSHYLALTQSKKHLLCYRGAYTHSWGHVPFDRVPGISSGTNRGYYSGRFRADHEIEGNLEYRWYLTKHFGLAAFADSAKVFQSGEKIGDALFTDYHPALGGGIRIVIPPEIIFRLDYGVSPEQSNFYFTLGETF